MKKFFLSPNTLNLFKDCPRCFWFHMVKGKDYKRPEPPTSTLPSGMDRVIKDYFDRYRKKRLLPQELLPIIEAELAPQELIDKWRFWRTGLTFTDSSGSKLIGALDECLISDGVYIPVDYKTRGFDLKEDSTSYYILQMSCYAFLLSKNNYKVSNSAYLIFYIPSQIADQGKIDFKIEIRKVETYPPQKVYSIFKEALGILQSKEPPPVHSDCKFCNWANKVVAKEQSQLKLF